MISVQDAEAKILAEATPLGIEEKSLLDALGLFLADEIAAPVNLPPFDNSAMDGYAARSTDLAAASPGAPATIALIGTVAAGHVFGTPLEQGEAVQIMTGAPIPPGADTVVILEEARRRDGVVIIDHPVPAGRHIRRHGEDVTAGRVVLPRGRRIRPAEIALLSSLGISRVNVFRPPRVAILATGSELVGVDQPLRPGTIRDSNSWVLESYLRSCHVPIVNGGIIPDAPQAVLQAFREAMACDVILSSGGVSVGEHDLVKRILLKEFDFRTIFWRVRMKPGKPLLFGRVKGTLIFGLPGNPISCAVCFIRFIAPAIRKMMGDLHPLPATRRAVLKSAISIREPEKTHFMTATLEEGADRPHVTPTSHQGSGMLTSMTEGNAFIVVPEGAKELPAGALVEVIQDA